MRGRQAFIGAAWLVLGFVASTGCNDSSSTASAPAAPPKERAVVGIYPEKWTCDRIASLNELGNLLGGAIKPLDSAMAVPRGVPHPCSYEVAGAEPEAWTFDLDCRDGMKQRADALFAQYRRTSQELVEQYEAAQAEAKKHPAPKPAKPRGHDDAGVPAQAAPPTPAVDVAVGAKGLDHHNQGLLFIDDDAPCYVRVVGKDAARRLALAQLVARKLTLANAPMSPRPAP